jgi:hypothetical protein
MSTTAPFVNEHFLPDVLILKAYFFLKYSHFTNLCTSLQWIWYFYFNFLEVKVEYLSNMDEVFLKRLF